MPIFHKAGLALAVLGALGQTTSAHAMGITLAPSPAPVPEASTMISLSLLLALGLGGVAARRKQIA